MEPTVTLSPEQELEQLRTDRASGKISNAEWNMGKAARFEELAGLAASGAPAPAPIPDAQRLAMMADLRQRRADGRCTDAEWKNFEALAEGRTPQPKPVPQTLEQQLIGTHTQADPKDYNFDRSPHFKHTPESLLLDVQLRAAFSAAGVPASFGNAIFEAADRTIQELEHATPEARQAKLGEVRAHLQRVWGPSYESRMDAIDELVAVITAHSDDVAAYIDAAPWMFAHLGVMNWLDQVAQQRLRQLDLAAKQHGKRRSTGS